MQITVEQLNAITSVITNAETRIYELIGIKVRVKFVQEGVYNMSMLLGQICTVLDVSINKVTSQSRETDVLHVRMIFSYLCMTLNMGKKVTLAEIADYVGRADHTTIRNNIKQAIAMLQTQHKDFVEKMDKVKRLLYIQDTEINEVKIDA